MSSSQSAGNRWITSALARRITGEAFTTQRSGTPEFFFQLLHRQLDWGNVMFGQNVKKFSASEFEGQRSLPLGQSTLLEPSKYGRLPHFVGKLLRPYVDRFRGIFRKLHCDRSSHGHQYAHKDAHIQGFRILAQSLGEFQLRRMDPTKNVRQSRPADFTNNFTVLVKSRRFRSFHGESSSAPFLLATPSFSSDSCPSAIKSGRSLAW